MKKNVIEKMNENYSKLSRGQKKLVSFITDNYDVAVFYTASELGKAVGVSESTVVRFAASLGYKGYPQFQKELESWVHKKMMDSQSIDIIPERLDKRSLSYAVLKAEQENLSETFANITTGKLKTAAKMIVEARKIYILGVRESMPVAFLMERQLMQYGLDVINLSERDLNDMFDRLAFLKQGDVVIGISFPRYSKKTLKVLELANSKRAKVITITDSIFSPLNMYSSCNVVASVNISAEFISMAAPISIANVICMLVMQEREHEYIKNLEMMEDFWTEFGDDCNDELDHVSETLKNRYKVREN